MHNIDLAKRAALIERKSRDDKRLLFVASNNLIFASYNLTQIENKFIRYVAALAREKNCGFLDEDPIIIDVKEFADFFGIAASSAYQTLINLSDRIFESKVIHVPDDLNVVKKANFFNSIRYFRGEGRIGIVFSDDLRRLITRLESGFTSIPLCEYKKLSTSAEIRVLEIANALKFSGRRYFSVDDIRLIFGCGQEKYSDFSDLKRKIISPALKAVSDESRFSANLVPVKKGRKISGFNFVVFMSEAKK